MEYEMLGKQTSLDALPLISEEILEVLELVDSCGLDTGGGPGRVGVAGVPAYEVLLERVPRLVGWTNETGRALGRGSFWRHL